MRTREILKLLNNIKPWASLRNLKLRQNYMTSILVLIESLAYSTINYTRLIKIKIGELIYFLSVIKFVPTVTLKPLLTSKTPFLLICYNILIVTAFVHLIDEWFINE